MAGGSGIGHVYYEVLPDIGDFEKRVTQEVGAAVDNAQRKVGQKMRNWGLGLTAGLTMPAVVMGRTVRDAAANLIDSMGAVEQVYGDSAKTIIDWINGVKEAEGHYYGLGRGVALEAAATLFPLTRSFAEGEEQAKITIELLKMAADMSAYAGTTVEEALAAIQSGMTGMPIPLRRYGIQLSETALIATAAQHGIIDTSLRVREAIFKQEEAERKLTAAINAHGEESLEAEKASIALAKAEEALRHATEGRGIVLNEAERTEAAYLAIMERGAYLQGQYAREVDSLGGAMKEAEAAKQRAAEAAGEALAPAMTKLYEAQAKVYETISKIPGPLMEVIGIAAGAGAAAGPVLTLAGSFLELATNIRLTRAVSGGLSATSVAGASGVGLAGAGALGAAAKVGGVAIAAGAVGYGIGTLINQHLPKLWGEDQHLSDILSGRNRAIDPTPTARELEVERQLAAAQARNRGGTMGPITVNNTFTYQAPPAEQARAAEQATRGTLYGYSRQ